MAESISGQTPATGPTHGADFSPTDFSAGSPETPLRERELPAAGTREQQMQEVAEKIGGVLGTAVRHARGVSGRVRGGLELVRGRMADQAAQVSEGASEAASQLPEAGSEFKDRASDTFADWNQAARNRVSQARQRMEEIKTKYPLQVMFGLAAAFFVIGFGIRLWRSTRE